MLSYQGLAHQTIKTYLSAVRHMHTFLGHSPLPSMPRLRLVLNGALRLQPVLRRGTPRNRLPITPHILSQLRTVWVSHQDRAYGAMLWVAATMCFFGFLRSGEITTPSLSGYDPQSHLSWGDIDKFASPSCVRVHLRRSKCDPFGRGVDVYFGRTDNVVCPVRALLTYVASRGNHAGPFFVHPDSTPLTKTHFTDAVCLALQHAGLEPRDYAGHSFRISAATTAASAGMVDSLIQTLGRWCSAAFVSYIRTPPTQLAAVSARISALPLQQ